MAIKPVPSPLRPSGSSMIPEAPIRHEPIKEPAPDIRRLQLDPTDVRTLARLIQESSALGEQEREAKKLRKPVTDQIKGILKKYPPEVVSRFICDDIPVQYYDSPRSILSRELLLSRGVKPEVLTACTVTNHSWTLRIGSEWNGGSE